MLLQTAGSHFFFLSHHLSFIRGFVVLYSMPDYDASHQESQADWAPSISQDQDDSDDD